jgi:hypothetical protein
MHRGASTPPTVQKRNPSHCSKRTASTECRSLSFCVFFPSLRVPDCYAPCFVPLKRKARQAAPITSELLLYSVIRGNTR